MSAIKPPGGPRGPGAADGPNNASRTGKSSDSKTASSAASAGATKPSDPSNGVIAELRAGRLTPDQAVQRLTQLAVDRNGTPASMRPAVEARVRELLGRVTRIMRDLLATDGRVASRREVKGPLARAILAALCCIVAVPPAVETATRATATHLRVR